MKKIGKYLVIATGIIALTSCNFLKKEYTTLTYSQFDYATLYNGLTPSVGDVNLLIVPIEFSDKDSFTEEQLNNINYSFNGYKDDNSNDYWESLKSYYNKSSYGKLNFNCTISDVFTPSFSSSLFVAKENANLDYFETGTHVLAEEVYNNATINSKPIDYKNFDSNKDGYVDGVWFIFNAGTTYEVFNLRYYWAYTSWMMNTKANINKPTFSTFANCSQIFLYEAEESNGQDAHTIIHETGHMMGLDDYYTYDKNVRFSSSGGKMMMDNNIGDHDAFSKFALGWITPKLVTKEEEISLKSFGKSGDALIISSDFVGNAFDEYLIIEFYTPDLLNEKDSITPYNEVLKNNMFKEPGIIVYHVDARIAHINLSSDGDGSTYFYVSNDISKFKKSNISIKDNYITGEYYSIAASNSKSKKLGENAYFLIEQINKNNISFYNKSLANDDSLYHKGDTFDSNSLFSFFSNSTFHNKKKINFNFTVLDINQEEAKLKFNKI